MIHSTSGIPWRIERIVEETKSWLFWRILWIDNKWDMLVEITVCLKWSFVGSYF